ncbi:uncharacterized protein DDB_G0293534-like [Monomorium pharaonis]|uniref:uncharacterized protein DDB_G0293534-like n=1 Tax=Monomorium pharaonis TaxID=307658 RepID=UPI001747612D|nr:uncharacterized protein DDB_G0293534-like [Monomorium pharaonis]
MCSPHNSQTTNEARTHTIKNQPCSARCSTCTRFSIVYHSSAVLHIWKATAMAQSWSQSEEVASMQQLLQQLLQQQKKQQQQQQQHQKEVQQKLDFLYGELQKYKEQQQLVQQPQQPQQP